MKIAIIGYSGCGKSTLAKHLSELYNSPLLYLDTVRFISSWRERAQDEALRIVSAFLDENSAWVIDGNYRAFFQERRLEEADLIVYMAFTRLNCLMRAFRRYRRYRNKTRESIAPGCHEKMDASFVWWILHKGRTASIKRHYAGILKKYGHKTVVLKNQKQLDKFMLLSVKSANLK